MNSYSTILNAAVASVQSGDWDRTLTLTNQLLRLSPTDSNALHIHAIALTHKGSHDEAEAAARKAIAAIQHDPSCHNTLGNILRAKHRYADALREFQTAAQLAPGVPDYHNSIGLILNNMGSFAASIPFLEAAIRLDRRFAKAYMNLGLSYEGLDRYQEALRYLTQAAALAPADEGVAYELASFFLRHHCPAKAIEVSTHFIGRVPTSYRMHVLLGEAYDLDGNYGAALAAYENAQRRFPKSIPLKLRRALLLPHIPSSNKEIDLVRRHFLDNLDALMQESLSVEELECENIRVPFYGTYYGRNETEARVKLARLFSAVCPALHYVSAHCTAHRTRGGRKIRVGLVDNFLLHGSGLGLYDGLIGLLANDPALEFCLLRLTTKRQDELQKHLRQGQLKIVPKDLARARQSIAALQLDVLLYSELSLSLSTYLLAFARLAPIQAVFAWGHPVTSGISTVDYALSTSLMEPANAQEHYTEKLVQLSSWPFVFHEPRVPAANRSRGELNLPEGTLYACPLLPFRIHPDMDPVFVEILERDPAGKIVLFGGEHENQWVPSLKARMKETIPAGLRDRVIVLPFAQGDTFIQTLRNVDCVLDAFHFSMGVTALPIFAAGLPVVTWPGEVLRGRAVFSFYKRMGLMDLVAKDRAHYVELAVNLAHEPARRERMGEEIKSRMKGIWEDHAGIEEVVAFIKDTHARQVAPT
jgi:protein O-GlcNAc transferase